MAGRGWSRREIAEQRVAGRAWEHPDQDVTVRRSLAQRIWGIGDLRIETAGKSSALEIANVEDPQKSADQILDSIQRG